MNTAFERNIGKEEWLTPPGIIRALGEFDLDPCFHESRPWDTAKKHYTKEDDGLKQSWFGRVWLNPPYGSQTGLWLKKLRIHGDGIALTFARTETKMFFSEVWERADAVFFIRGRLRFYDMAGIEAKNSAGAPSVLIAYGKRNVRAIEASGLDGILLPIPRRLYLSVDSLHN